MSNDSTNQPEFLSQLTKVITGADHGSADVVTDPDAVASALGALADAIPAGEDKPLSLGEQLKRNNAAKAERLAREQADEQIKQERKATEEVSKVRAFFSAAWGQFTTNIANGNEPGRVVLESFRDNSEAASLLQTHSWSLRWGSKWQKGGKGIWNQPHKFSRQWTEFLEGCREQGLEPVWTNEHDGVGMRDWWVLTVEAYEPEPAVSVDAAMGGILDEIGAKLVRGGLEDASGARRLIRDALAQGNFALAARMLGSDEVWARALWNRHNRGQA